MTTVEYQDYIPQTPNGTIYSQSVYPEPTHEFSTDYNTIVQWNQTLKKSMNHSYVLSVHIIQNPIVISDLTGSSSVTIQDINNKYPSIIKSYCHSIGNETVSIIDPNHPVIRNIAHQIKEESNTDNAYLLGKQLFLWLKNHTSYNKHEAYQPQPAILTYESGVGDCDDLTYLYLSLCRSIGIPGRYIKGYIIKNTSAVPHVWAELFVGKQLSPTGWIPVECAGTAKSSSEIHNHYGLEDAHHLRLCIDDGTNQTFHQLNNPLSVEYTQNIDVNISRIEIVHNFSIISTAQLVIEDNQRRYQ